MITRHDEEIIEEIINFDIVRTVADAYTVYEQLCTRKAISKREFMKMFDDYFQVFSKIFSEGIEE